MPGSRPPNLLLVFADQMRGQDMGCAGNRDVRTPTLDRLAADGVRLRRCYATCPVCCPNRATLLTGAFPTTSRVVSNDLPVRTDLPTLATIARANGYRTGYIGKWHLDGMPRDRFTPPGPRRLGFEYWAAYNCAHDYFHPRWFEDTPVLHTADGYEPEVQTDLALAYLERHARTADPFCLVVSWGPPHDPYEQVPRRYRDMYDPFAIALRPNARPGSRNPLAAQREARRTLADYYAAITALDEQLARLIARLRDLDAERDTLVVFTSDHGDMLWSHGWMKKQSPFEEAILVPAVLRWPGGLPAGGQRDTLVATVDLLPTLAGLMGWKDVPSLEGSDLSRAVRGERAAARPHSVLIANYHACDEAAVQGMPTWRGVRTERHTYVELPGRRPWLLYDNVADPYQLRNLAESAAEAGPRAALAADLGGWLDRTGDAFPDGPGMLARLGLTEAWAERERLMHGGHAPNAAVTRVEPPTPEWSPPDR